MRLKLYFITVVAALGGFLFGFDTAVISGTDAFVVPHFGLDDAQWGFTVSSALLGTIIGAIFAGFPAQRLGRRDSLFITATLYLISAILCALAPTWALLVGGRFIGGIGVGLASVLSPMYIAEMAPAHLRGRLVAVAQLNIVVGILIAYFSNDFLMQFPSNWRLMFGAEAIPALLFLILLFFVPRSPRWLISKGRVDEAVAVLDSIYHDKERAAEVISDIKESLATPTANFPALFQPRYRNLALLAFLLASFNQLTGINCFIYYAPRILTSTGLSIKDALWQTFISVGVTNLIFTVLAMLAIDKFGRKTLMIAGSVGLFFSLALMSYAYFSQTFDRTIIMAALIGFIASFAFSQGAVMWVFLAEVFPNQVRAHGQALGSFTHWVWNFLVSLLFPIAMNGVGGGAVFGFFAVMMVFQFACVIFMMPETRGKTLESLEKELAAT